MNKNKPQPQEQSDGQCHEMTKKEALDILLKNVAESKKQIAQGHYYTHEQVCTMLESKRNARKV